MKALDLMVNDLKDPFWAERICVELPSLNLLENLLQLYLKCPTRDYSQEISSLISSHVDSFDVSNLVRTLPSNWSINLLSQILSSRFQKLGRENTSSKLILSLSKAKYSSTKQKVLCAVNSYVALQQNTNCTICGIKISTNQFSLGINGVFHQACK
jgi:hypothetical protein